MGQAKQGLSQQQTGQPTQGQQDQAIQKLAASQKAGGSGAAAAATAATAAANGAKRRSQARQPEGQQAQRPLPRLEGVQKGAMSAPTARNGKGFSPLSQRDQRVMRDGENERVPAEYQDLVSRYYKSLAEKKR